jgi:DNA repair protein RecO (recombination protein O)
MRYILTKALILRKQPSGENDWFLTLLSPEHGKIQAISRSSRKILSQKGCHMDPLNLCNFQLYKKADRFMVTDCKLETPFLGIKSDLAKSLLGFTILELLLKTIQENEDNFALFKLTLKALEKLNETSDELNLEEFKIKLLKIAGSWPEVSNCHQCQHKWTPENLINCDQEGRFYCETCVTSTNTSGQLISFNTIKLANYLSQEHVQKINLVISEQELFHLKQLTAIFLGKYLHHELKSEKLMQN